MTVDLKLEKSTLFYESMDNIGKNEKLLRSSKDFQKLGEGYGTIGRALGMSRSTVATIVKREKVAV